VTSPPAELLALEGEGAPEWSLSSGDRPAAGILRVEGVLLGAVLSFEELGDDDIDFDCTLWMREPAGRSREVGEFGVWMDRGRLDWVGAAPSQLQNGGQDIETDTGREWHFLAVCGDVAPATSVRVIVDGAVRARVDRSSEGRFFCIPAVVPALGEHGVDPVVEVEPVSS
jgi:hypothetical protein